MSVIPALREAEADGHCEFEARLVTKRVQPRQRKGKESGAKELRYREKNVKHYFWGAV